MFNMGTQEILIILALALIVFGPKKLPEIGRTIGQGLRELKKASREVMDTIENVSEPEPAPTWTPDHTPDHAPDDAPDQAPGDTKETTQNAADSNRIGTD